MTGDSSVAAPGENLSAPSSPTSLAEPITDVPSAIDLDSWRLKGGTPGRGSLVGALVTLAAICLVALLLLALPSLRLDPYSRATLALKGSDANGERLFLINCAGCHGIDGQGLVGPNLHGVRHRKNDRQLIQQVVSGATPPMPRFQPDPQAMADLLAHLHSLM